VKNVLKDVVLVNMMLIIVLVAQVLEKVLQLVLVQIHISKKKISIVKNVTTLVLLVNKTCINV
jgi:hypothetical protein